MSDTRLCSSNGLLSVVIVACPSSEKLLKASRRKFDREAWMHRAVGRRTCSSSLHGFVGNFGRQVDEQFRRCQSTFHKQEILNDSVASNSMDSDPESELVDK